LLLLAAAVFVSGCRSNDDAMLRGDRFWADSNFVAALGEYRLAARQTDQPEAHARVAHGYIVTGQLDRAVRTYETLVKMQPEYVDQAVFDYVWLAQSSLQRGDRYLAARAAEAALALRPGLAMPQLELTLARHFATIGETERGLPFFQRALASADREDRPALLYEMAVLSERNGGCLEALPLFERFTQESANADSVTEARWRMGTCGLEQGRQARAAGQMERALELLQLPLDLGAPQNQLDQAWFERAEALLALGNSAQAFDAFQRVVDIDAGRRSPLAGRAQRRLDELRNQPLVP
jgi:tetratricopeptide (TPR) repeat protein